MYTTCRRILVRDEGDVLLSLNLCWGIRDLVTDLSDSSFAHENDSREENKVRNCNAI